MVPYNGIRAISAFGLILETSKSSTTTLKSIDQKMPEASLQLQSLIEDAKQMWENQACDYEELNSLILGLYPRSTAPVATSSIDTGNPSFSNEEEDKEITPKIEDLEALMSNDLNCSKQNQISGSFPSFNHQLIALHMPNLGNGSPNLDGNIDKKKVIVERKIIDDDSKMEGGAMIKGKIAQILVDHSKFEDIEEVSKVFDEIPHKNMFNVSAHKMFNEIPHKNMFIVSAHKVFDKIPHKNLFIVSAHKVPDEIPHDKFLTCN